MQWKLFRPDFRESSRRAFQLTYCSVEKTSSGVQDARISQIQLDEEVLRDTSPIRVRCEKVQGDFKASVPTYSLKHREEAISDICGEIQPEPVGLGRFMECSPTKVGVTSSGKVQKASAHCFCCIAIEVAPYDIYV